MRSFDYFPCLSCWLGPLAVATHSLKLPDYLSSAQDQLDEAVRFCPAAEFSSPKKKKGGHLAKVAHGADASGVGAVAPETRGLAGMTSSRSPSQQCSRNSHCIVQSAVCVCNIQKHSFATPVEGKGTANPLSDS